MADEARGTGRIGSGVAALAVCCKTWDLLILTEQWQSSSDLQGELIYIVGIDNFWTRG